MSPALVVPAALATLTALIIPLVIHIARRSEQLPTDFAALRWLRQKPRPRSRLRFDEWPLLILRLLLVALIALWLAQPVLFGAADRTAYVAVVPGVDMAQARAAIGEKARAHWLAPGFPAIDEAQPGGSVPLASLIRQLDAELPADAALRIVAPQVIEGADAERPRLSRKIDWRVVPGAMPATKAAPPAIPSLTIRYDAAHASAIRFLRAAALAWQPAGRDADVEIGGTDAAVPGAGRVLVWLAAGSLPAPMVQWVEQGGTALIANDMVVPGQAPRATAWHDDAGRPLVEAIPMGGGTILRFTRRLLPADMPALLEPDFPAQLRALLEHPAPPTRVAATDYQPVAGGRRYDQPPTELRPWLALLAALLLVAERWLATRRSRGVNP